MSFAECSTEEALHDKVCHDVDGPCPSDSQSCRATVTREQLECRMLELLLKPDLEITNAAGIESNSARLMDAMTRMHKHLLQSDGPAIFHTPYTQPRSFRVQGCHSHSHHGHHGHHSGCRCHGCC